jgi:hypothetical protein
MKAVLIVLGLLAIAGICVGVVMFLNRKKKHEPKSGALKLPGAKTQTPQSQSTSSTTMNPPPVCPREFDRVCRDLATAKHEIADLKRRLAAVEKAANITTNSSVDDSELEPPGNLSLDDSELEPPTGTNPFDSDIEPNDEDFELSPGGKKKRRDEDDL